MKVDKENIIDGNKEIVFNSYMNDKLTQQQKMIFENDGIYIKESNGMNVRPKQPYLIFPLEVGKSWNWEGKVGLNEMKVNSEIVSKEKFDLEEDEIEVFVLKTETKSGSNEISIKRLLSNKYGVVHEETVIRNEDKKQKIVSKLQDYTIN